jgi:hypothetical protein
MYTLLVWCVYLTIEGSLAALPRFGGGHDKLHDRLHQPRDGSHPPHYGAHAGQELARRVPVLLVVHLCGCDARDRADGKSGTGEMSDGFGGNRDGENGNRGSRTPWREEADDRLRRGRVRTTI